MDDIAPAETTETLDAPADASSATKPPAPGETAATPKPRTVDDDIEDVFKKAGGLKYKAGGKEKAVTSAADLRRLLSRVDGTDSAASEALKRTQEADTIKNRLASVAKLPPRERLGALKEAGVDPALIREALEEQILEEDEKARRQQHLTAEQRAFLADKEKFEAERGQYQQQQRQAKEQAEQEAYVQRVIEVGKRLEQVAVGALQRAKIGGEHAQHFLQAIAERLDRNERLGLGLDEGEVADVVMKEQASLARGYYNGVGVSDHADELDSMEMPDPSDPNKKTTRAKLLMQEFARRIRAKQNGTPGPGYSVSSATQPPRQSNGASQTVAEKMAAARTFGGGR